MQKRSIELKRMRFGNDAVPINSLSINAGVDDHALDIDEDKCKLNVEFPKVTALRVIRIVGVGFCAFICVLYGFSLILSLAVVIPYTSSTLVADSVYDGISYSLLNPTTRRAHLNGSWTDAGRLLPWPGTSFDYAGAAEMAAAGENAAEGLSASVISQLSMGHRFHIINLHESLSDHIYDKSNITTESTTGMGTNRVFPPNI